MSHFARKMVIRGFDQHRHKDVYTVQLLSKARTSKFWINKKRVFCLAKTKAVKGCAPFFLYRQKASFLMTWLKCQQLFIDRTSSVSRTIQEQFSGIIGAVSRENL